MNKNFGTLPGRTDNYFVYKTRSGKNLIAREPMIDTNPRRQKLSLQDDIRRAVTYAEFAWDQPIYQCKAVGSSNSAYNLAVADALGKPQILDIDLHGWTRKIGQTILVTAKDNFLVLSVRLVIRDGAAVIEEGEAEQSELDGLLWRYALQTTVERRPGLFLDAYASDLPGNVGKYTIELR
jgi:hypothetical protein